LGINDYFFVESGNVNAGAAYIVNAPSGTITFGTSNITFAEFSKAQIYSANTSAGISLAGTVINALVDNVTTAFSTGNIVVKASAQLTTPNIGAATGTSLSTTGNITGGNVSTGGLISSTGNITGGNLSGTSIVGTLTTAAQTNITSVGTLTSLAVTGNISGGNLSGTSIVGTLTTAAQTNITSVGTLTSLAVTGNISGGNLSGTSIVGTLTTAAQTNITSVGTLTSLAVTGNTTSGNFVGTLNGSGANVTSISATNISSGTLAQARLANASVTLGSTALTLGSTVTTVAGLTSVTSTTFVGALTGAATSATTAATVTTAAQPNITSVGTLTGLTINNATTAITNGAANGVGNIGSSSVYFNTGFLKATTAQYADLAENYSADAVYAPGTVLVFGGDNEVTIANMGSDPKVAGVVSTNPAHLMNSVMEAEHTVAVALTGRVPAQVIGPVKKGDMMVSAINGRAQACATPAMGTVIGKALENFNGESGVIEIVVGRL
jgi:hypothetical protein